VDAVLDPVKAHVQCFGFALTGGSISDASCSGVMPVAVELSVCMPGDGRLGVAHFDQGGA